MQADALVLRDIHQPPAPSWWPPAPGWWMVLGLLVLAAAIVAWCAWRRRQRRRVLACLFDDSVLDAGSPAAQVAAMSELLRRAGRRRDPTADRLVGEEWLRFLDQGAKQPLFDGDAGQLLLEGGFRRSLEADAVAALVPRARARFLAWMTAR